MKQIVIFSYPLHSTSTLWGPCHSIAIPLGTEKLDGVWPDVDKVW